MLLNYRKGENVNKFRNFLTSGVIAAALIIGGSAAAQAADGSGEDGVLETIAQIAHEANGDAEALELLKDIVPLQLTYCNDRYSLIETSPAGTYRVPVRMTSSSPPNWNCYLESGNNNIAVQDLQESLNQCHGKSLTLDGIFGPATYTAVLQVQTSLGITADGVYGPQTRNAMSWWGGSACKAGSTFGF